MVLGENIDDAIKMGTSVLMRCPCCGHATVVLASGGHLTCTWGECPQPVVERTVKDLLAQSEELKALRARVDQVNDLLTRTSSTTLDVRGTAGGKATTEVIRPADVLRPGDAWARPVVVKTPVSDD